MIVLIDQYSVSVSPGNLLDSFLSDMNLEVHWFDSGASIQCLLEFLDVLKILGA